MCERPARWQITVPKKPSITVCREHLGAMIEAQMPKEPGQSFAFNLVFVASIPGFKADCLYVEAAQKVELSAQPGEQKVLQGPELTPSLGAQSSVEVK